MVDKKDTNTEEKSGNGEKKNEDKEKPQKEEAEKETQALEEKVKELEKKFGEQGASFEQLKEFTDGATVVIQTIAGNPELTKVFREELTKRYGSGGQIQDKQKNEEQDKNKSSSQPSDEVESTLKDVTESQRNQLVRSFEEKYGIDKMKPEEAKEARQKIATFLADFGWQIKTLPLQTLSKNLERAFVATHAEKLREEGKLEGLVASRSNDLGTMQSISGGAPALGGESGELTDGQKGWTKKLGVNEDKAAKTYKSRDEEQTRVSPSEKKKE